MKIYYFVRRLDAIPSCIYNMLMLKELGYSLVPVIGRSSETISKELEAFNEKYIVSTTNSQMSTLDKVRMSLQFIKLSKEILKTKVREDDIVCLGTADTAIDIHKYVGTRKCILFLLELHEKPASTNRKLNKIAHKVDEVVCCEPNRSRYLKFEWNLDKKPDVISNKPYMLPTKKCIEPSTEQNRKIIESLKGKNVIIYQARHIHFAQEIINLAKALKELQEDILLVLMGEVDSDNDRKNINAIYDNILWTGNVIAPLHLEITSYAKIGVAVYQESSLNNMFCAPNKIFEYSAFGIPSLCNDVPGLVETIGLSKAGICVNWDSVDEIKNAIKMIYDDYGFYERNSTVFFKHEDNVKKIDNIIKKVME